MLAVLAVCALLGGGLAIDSGALDATRQAMHELARGVLAATVLFAVAGYAVTERLAPSPIAPLRLLLVLPVGAVVSSLALTALGFARVPIDVSIALVLLAGGVAAWHVRRRLPRRPHDVRVAAFAAVGAVAVVLALVPLLRAGYATVPGQNPDAHLVTGTALLLERAAPTSTRTELPVDEVPQVWRSKYPIFYSLAAVSKLARLDPISAFPALAALLTGFVAVGFGLFGVYALRLSLAGGLLVCGIAALNAMTLYLALHPYWNQLWGLALMPFTLLFAWLAVADRDVRASVLFVLTGTLAGLAYPLALPYPLLALAGFAIVLRRRPRLPQWSRRRWTLTLFFALLFLAIPLAGAIKKVVDGVGNFLHPSPSWIGDLPGFLPLGDFVSTGGGALPLVLVAVFAVVGLIAKVPRPQALVLAGVLAISALADVRLRLSHFGTYVDFKHLTFVGMLLLTFAASGALWMLARRQRAWAAAGAVGLIAFTVATVDQVRRVLTSAHEQVTIPMLELRAWSAALPRHASVRLDIPPSGFQLWAGYFMTDHPLVTSAPLLGTTYPHAPYGYQAAYSLALSPALNAQFAKSGSSIPPLRDTLEPPVRWNAQFVLRRIAEPAGPPRASQRMVQDPRSRY
jgi:hypothetical protein